MLQANNNNDEDDVLAFAFISIKIKVGGLLVVLVKQLVFNSRSAVRILLKDFFLFFATIFAGLEHRQSLP